jgi:hypothetical protein
LGLRVCQLLAVLTPACLEHYPRRVPGVPESPPTIVW